MQRITAIVGLRQEGKSTELVNEFVDQVTVGSVKKVFISCVPKGKLLEDIDGDIITMYEVIGLPAYLKTIHKDIVEEQVDDNTVGIVVDDEEELINYIKEQVSKSDVIFYIDDPEVIFKDFFNTILDISNSYPNNDCDYSFDVIYTIKRGVV